MIGSFEAKNKLAELLEAAASGEEIGITKRGRLMARLVPPQSGHDVDTARAALSRLKGKAKTFSGRFTWEELKSFRDEGRR